MSRRGGHFGEDEDRTRLNHELLFCLQRSTFNGQRSFILLFTAGEPQLDRRCPWPWLLLLRTIASFFFACTASHISITASICQRFKSYSQLAARPSLPLQFGASAPLRARQDDVNADETSQYAALDTTRAQPSVPLSAATRVDEPAPRPNAIDCQPESLGTCRNKPIRCWFSSQDWARLDRQTLLPLCVWAVSRSPVRWPLSAVHGPAPCQSQRRRSR